MSITSEPPELLFDAVDEPLAAGPLTLAEVLVGPARAGTSAAPQGALRDLQIRAAPLEDDAPMQLAMLGATSRLRLPACCVLLAAQTTHAAVATFGERLADAAKDLGLGVRR